MQKTKEYIKNIDFKKLLVQLLFYVIGNLILTFGATLMMSAGLGASGHDTMNYAISRKFGIRLSFAVYGTAIVLVLTAAVIRRRLPRISAFVTAFFVGLFLEMWEPLLEVIQPTNYFVKILLSVAGAVTFAIGVAVYMAPNLGIGPPDEIVDAISQVSGVRFGIVKIAFDFTCCAVAFFLGGKIGVGVIIATFLVGPLVDIFSRWVKPLVPETFLKTELISSVKYQ